jgi:hypothetical protein
MNNGEFDDEDSETDPAEIDPADLLTQTEEGERVPDENDYESRQSPDAPPEEWAHDVGRKSLPLLDRSPTFDYGAVDAAAGWKEPGEASGDDDEAPAIDAEQERFRAAEALARVCELLGGAPDLKSLGVRALAMLFVFRPDLLGFATGQAAASRFGISKALLNKYAVRVRDSIPGFHDPLGRSELGRAHMSEAAHRRAQSNA